MCWIRNTYSILITFNCSLNIYSCWAVYITLVRLVKACLCSRNSSRPLINTIFTITNICVYINTNIRTSNFTIYRNTIITINKWNFLIYINTRWYFIKFTIYINTISCSITCNSTLNCYSITITFYSSTILIKTCITSLNSSRSLLNTICRRFSITNVSIYINTIFRTTNYTIRTYINTTFRTIHFTIYLNTIIIIFKWNIRIYINTIIACIVTFNGVFNNYTINGTVYSSRILNNTICSVCFIFTSNISNISIYINTAIRTFNCTIYLNTTNKTTNFTISR